MSAAANRGRWFRQHTVSLPTWRAWLLLCLTVLPAGLWCLSHLHGWRSVSAPVSDAPYVVVEGWVGDTVVRQAYEWSKTHPVKMILTTGIPMEQGGVLATYPTYAEMCAATLVKLGADPAKVKPAPALKVNLERPTAMAVGLRHAVEELHVPAGDRKLNLFPNGTHAFRSRMLFQRALGPEWQVGVVSVPPPGYMPGAWWKYSEGIKSVLEEVIAIAGQGWGRVDG